jgi:hypothetical protein
MSKAWLPWEIDVMGFVVTLMMYPPEPGAQVISETALLRPRPAASRWRVAAAEEWAEEEEEAGELLPAAAVGLAWL